jgi:hypothetical protein
MIPSWWVKHSPNAHVTKSFSYIMNPPNRIRPIFNLLMPNHKHKMPSSTTLRSTAMPFQLSPSLNHLMIPLKTWLRQSTYSDRLAVGGLIFHPTANTTRLFILQGANNESAFPNVWEILGGTCKASDETILHSLAWEIHEETDLTLQSDRVLDVESGTTHLLFSSLK